MSTHTDFNEIDIETLRKIVACDPETGTLTYLPRPRSMFSSDRGWRAFNAAWAGKPALSASSAGYKSGSLLGKSFRAHRVVYALTTGHWPKQLIDHINGNPADNRFANLRVVSQQENMMNRSVRVTNTSGITGVDFNKNSGKWRARLCVGRRTFYLGYYVDKWEAAAAWQRAKEQHGVILKSRSA